MGDFDVASGAGELTVKKTLQDPVARQKKPIIWKIETVNENREKEALDSPQNVSEPAVDPEDNYYQTGNGSSRNQVSV